MRVVVETHNPAWATSFSKAKKDLQVLLKDVPVISIEHVGSTSVPDLPAKPILDISIIVTAQNIPDARAALVDGGYIDLGDMGIPDRYAFRQPGFEPRDSGSGASPPGEKEMNRNVYVVVEGCLSLRNHLAVKRVLLDDEALRQEYGNTKVALGGRDVADIDEYCRGKNEVILKILSKAGLGEEELEEVRIANA